MPKFIIQKDEESESENEIDDNVAQDWTISQICRKCVPKSWEQVFEDSLEDLDHISDKIQEIEKTKKIVPNKCDLFKAFHLTSLNEVKVAIIAMDPYQNLYKDNIPIATGIAFSIEKGRTLQPSLRNIFKEINDSCEDFTIPEHGDLTNWTKQGVLLLNICLTTEVGVSGAHSKKMMWMGFIKRVFEAIGRVNPNCIFLLLGKDAQAIKPHLKGKQIIIETSHPSPFSANKGFLGSGVFKEINNKLLNPPKRTKKQEKENPEKVELKAIDWNL